MAKFSRKSKLPAKETQMMIMDLCTAMAATNNTSEAEQVLTDLLGKQELEMIAKRLKIAELLFEGLTCHEIKQTLKVSDPTIARVHSWMKQSGEGYRLVRERTKSKRKNMTHSEEPVKLSLIKRKYPMYFWPQIMLEYWLKNSNKREKQEIKNILDKLGNKRKLYSQLDNLLNQ